MYHILILLSLSLFIGDLSAEENRVLFKFEEVTEMRPWQAVNDGVMGGRSIGKLQQTDNQTLKFYGTLSLENNGGFASVRARSLKPGMNISETIVMRVRGDGRTYDFNLYVPTQMTAYSFRQSFETKKGEWTEVELPLAKFQATWFGRSLTDRPLDAAKVNGIGILLGDKKAGPFELEIDWIKVRPKAE